MAASAARLEQRQHATGTAGGLTVRAAVDAFLDSPKINRSPHTRRAYANVLDRTADVLGAERDLAGVSDAELGEALTGCGAGVRSPPGTATGPPLAPGWPGVPAGSTGTRRGCRPRSSGAARWRTPRRRCPDHGSTGCADVGTCRCGRRPCGGCCTSPPPGPAVRPAIRRGSRCAVSVPHVIHMVSPPLTVTRACLLDRSRSSTFRASTAPARCSCPSTAPAGTGRPPSTRETSAPRPVAPGWATTGPGSFWVTTATACVYTSCVTLRPPISARPASTPP